MGDISITTFGDHANGVTRTLDVETGQITTWPEEPGTGWQDEPMPTPNDGPAVWDLVKVDIDAREVVGVKTYGTRLQPHNGRDALRDAYAEALDLVVYLRQAIYEREGR